MDISDNVGNNIMDSVTPDDGDVEGSTHKWRYVNPKVKLINIIIIIIMKI